MRIQGIVLVKELPYKVQLQLGMLLAQTFHLIMLEPPEQLRMAIMELMRLCGQTLEVEGLLPVHGTGTLVKPYWKLIWNLTHTILGALQCQSREIVWT